MADHAAALPAKNKGNAFFKKKQWREAIAAYTEGIEIDPNWEVLYSNRSQAFFYLKKYDKALSDAECCMKANPEYVKGYHRAANALVRLERWIDAMGVLEKAYKKGFRANKDLAKLHDKVFERAEAMKQQQLRSKPKTEQIKAKGNAHFKNGEYDQALAAYAQVLKLANPETDRKLIVSCYCNRAICYQQQSDFRNVIQECNKALELDPDNAKALMRRSSAFEGMEKYRLALQDVRKVLLRHPKMTVANKAQHRLSGAVRRLKATKAGQY